MAPNLTSAGNSVLATWLEPVTGSKAHRLRFARLAGGVWGEPVTIVENERIVANWADVPSIAQGSSSVLVAHWAEAAQADGEAYDVILGRSIDGGKTWQRLGAAHDDGTATEHGFASLVPDGDDIRAYWLDGRASANGAHGATALRTGLVREKIVDGAEVDARVCDCCGTGAAETESGPVVAYRDRSDDEVRDIAVVRQIGAVASPPRALHDDGWKIAGCPVNGPSIAAFGRRAAVAWYTYAGGKPAVRIAFSTDAGETFAAPIEVDGAVERRAPLGRVDLVLDDKADAVVSWLASERDAATVYLRRVAVDGKVGPLLAAVAITAGHDAGFPRLARLDDTLVLAWTEAGQPSQVRTALVRLADVPAAEAAIASNAAPATPRVGAVGQAAPEYTTKTLDDKPASLAELRGKVVLLNLWATWCEPCRQELPVLTSLHQRWSGGGLQLVGVSVDQRRSATEVRTFAERRGLPYTLWLDREDAASAAFGAGALPMSVLIDQRGVIVWRRDGAIAEGDVELEKALAATLGALK